MQEAALLAQFETFSAVSQARILKSAREQNWVIKFLASGNPGALLDRAEAVKKPIKRKRKAHVDSAIDIGYVRGEAEAGGEVGDGNDDSIGLGSPITPVKKERKHGPHKCSVCGEEGHKKNTCEQNPDKPLKSTKKAKPVTPVSNERLSVLQKYLK